MAKLLWWEFEEIMVRGDEYIDGFVQIEILDEDLEELSPLMTTKEIGIHLLNERLNCPDYKKMTKYGWIGTDNLKVIDWDVTRIGNIFKLVPSEQKNV